MILNFLFGVVYKVLVIVIRKGKGIKWENQKRSQLNCIYIRYDFDFLKELKEFFRKFKFNKYSKVVGYKN